MSNEVQNEEVVVDREMYDEAVAELKKLGLRYEYQPYDYMMRQIRERKALLKSGSNASPQTYINIDVRGNVLEDDYSNYNLTYEPYRDVDDMEVGDKVVLNPLLTSRCARVDLVKLRELISEKNGILELISVNPSMNEATVGVFGGEQFILPAVVVERLVQLDKPKKKRKIFSEESNYHPMKGANQLIPIAGADGKLDLASIGLTPEQIIAVNDTRLSKSDKIRLLYKSDTVSIANIARAVDVHYSHAYCVIDAYRKLLK